MNMFLRVLTGAEQKKFSGVGTNARIAWTDEDVLMLVDDSGIEIMFYTDDECIASYGMERATPQANINPWEILGNSFMGLTRKTLRIVCSTLMERHI